MKVKVLSNINSGQFTAGDVVDLDDNEAQALVEAGAVAPFDENAEQDQPAADENEQLNNPPAEAPAEQPAAEQPADQGGAPADVPLDPAPEQPAEQLPAQPAGEPDGFPEQPVTLDGQEAPAANPSPEQIAQDIASTEGQPADQ